MGDPTMIVSRSGQARKGAGKLSIGEGRTDRVENFVVLPMLTLSENLMPHHKTISMAVPVIGTIRRGCMNY